MWHPPRSTRTHPLFPCTTLVRADGTLGSAAGSTRSGTARWSASAVSRCPARYWSAMLCSLQREVDGLRQGYGRARGVGLHDAVDGPLDGDRKSTRLNSSH